SRRQHQHRRAGVHDAANGLASHPIGRQRAFQDLENIAIVGDIKINTEPAHAVASYGSHASLLVPPKCYDSYRLDHTTSDHPDQPGTTRLARRRISHRRKEGMATLRLCARIYVIPISDSEFILVACHSRGVC